MENHSRIRDPRALILLVALLICLFSYQLLMGRALQDGPRDRPPAVAFYAVGVSVLILLVGRGLEAPQQEDRRPEEANVRIPMPVFAWLTTMEIKRRTVAGFGSLVMLLLVLRRLPLLGLTDNYGRGTLGWGVAILLYVIAVIPGGMHAWAWGAWWRSRQKLIIGVGLIVLLALVVRIWNLSSIPFTLSGDEGSQGLEAVRVIEGSIRNPFSTGWLGVPTLSFFFNSVTIRFLGRTVTALRLPWVIIGTLTVLNTFVLVKRLKGVPVALMTAALLATYHFHIHFSRLGSNQIADPFFMSLALLFLLRALERESRLDWVLTGVVTGLALYFYAGARLTPVVILAVLGYAFLRDPRGFWRKHGSGLVVAVGALLVTAAPMIQYAIRFPNDFNARLNQVGIIQSGWIPRAMAARGDSMAAVLFDQFLRASLAFNYYNDRTVWYGLPQPLLNPFFGGVFLLGLGYGTLRLLGRRADSRLAPMVAWWWGGMILGGMLTESPPSSQRLITLSIPVCFFIALAIWETMQLAHKGVVGIPGNAAMAMLVFLFGISSLVTYFVEYTPRRIFGGPYAELATVIAPHLNERKANHRFYFVGAPHMYWGIATLPYLVPDADAIDVTVPLSDIISTDPTLQKKDAIFIFIPQRREEIELVREAFPQGETRDIHSPVDGRLMVTLYEISR